MSMQVTLERDGHDQPWGFRLQGGVDVGLPLSVLRVLVGTPAESVLKKGDVVTKISQTGTSGLSHQQAVDLFNKAGNQLEITIKRSGSGSAVSVPSQPNVSALQATAAIRQQQQQQLAAQPLDPSQSPQVAALPRTTFVLKSDLPATAAPAAASSDEFSIQNQPYRTTPLVQPSARSINELGVGVGSYSHLRLQEDICTGVREPCLVPISPAQAQQLKANEFLMKQKTQQGLVNAASDHQRTGGAKSPAPAPVTGPIAGPTAVQLPPTPSFNPQITPSYKPPATQQPPAPQPAKYNSASGLYANQSSGVLAKKGGAHGMINPGRSHGPPATVILTPKKDYNPTESETWKLILENDPHPPSVDEVSKATEIDPEMNEHDPIFSEVYTSRKAPGPGQKPVRPAPSGGIPAAAGSGGGGTATTSTPSLQTPNNPGAAKAGSPRVPGSSGSAIGTPPRVDGSSSRASPSKGVSSVAAAALAEPSSSSGGRSPRNEPVPLYETNSIGGRKRIAQSSSFNKLMMSLMGE